MIAAARWSFTGTSSCAAPPASKPQPMLALVPLAEPRMPLGASDLRAGLITAYRDPFREARLTESEIWGVSA